MASVHQSTVSAKAFPLEPSDAGSILVARVSWQRIVVMIAAWVEIIVGVSFILALDTQSNFVFGAPAEGAGAGFARFSGVALIALGIALMPSNRAGALYLATRGLLIFNILATIFFASVAVATTFRGVLLWPVVSLHGILAIALAVSLRSKTSA